MSKIMKKKYLHELATANLVNMALVGEYCNAAPFAK